MACPSLSARDLIWLIVQNLKEGWIWSVLFLCSWYSIHWFPIVLWRSLHGCSHLHGHHPSLLSFSKLLALLLAACSLLRLYRAGGTHTEWLLTVKLKVKRAVNTWSPWGANYRQSPTGKSTCRRMTGAKECFFLLCSSWPHLGPPLWEETYFCHQSIHQEQY